MHRRFRVTTAALAAFVISALAVSAATTNVGRIDRRTKTISWGSSFASRTTVTLTITNSDKTAFDSTETYILAVMDGTTALATTTDANSTALTLSTDSKTLSGALYLNTTELVTDRLDNVTADYADYRVYLVVQDKTDALVLDDIRIHKTEYYYGVSDPTAATDVLTTKGDLLVYTTALARLPVGTDDYVLTADSTQASGMKWAENAGGGGAWDGDITDMDIDGGTDIGAALVDADLFVVDDGAGGTNRKSAISRVWTYISGKLATFKVDDLAAGDDNTDLDATTAKHGLMPKADKVKLDAISGTNTGDQTITLTGNVTGSGTGSFAATIAADAVTYDRMQDTTGTDLFLGRDTAGGGTVEEINAAAARTILNVEDGATGDQTGAEIKAAYEGEDDTNAYDDAAVAKLAAIEAAADVTDATNVAAAGAVMDADFTAADEVMVGTGAGTHGQVTLGASEFLAKKAAGAATNVTAAEARTILNVADGADVTANNAPQAHKDSHDPEDGTDALDCAAAGEVVGVAAAAEGSAHSFARSDHTHQIQHSIADNHIVTIDDADAADNDFAKFTADGIEGRSYAEVRSDINVEDGADVTDATNVDAAGAVMESDVDAKGDLFVATADNTLTRLAVGTNDHVLTADSGEASGLKWAAAGAASTPTLEVVFDAADLKANESSFAPLEHLDGTNVDTLVRAFDDSTEEYADGKLQVPGDIDTSGTVTFRAYVSAKTAAASKNVALTFGHLARNDSEAYDTAHTDEDSGDKAIDATQGDLTEITWTETVSNLGWAANDLVYFRVSRPDASSDDLSGDLYLHSFTIEIPR